MRYFATIPAIGVAFLSSFSAEAGPIAAAFGESILGLPWGSNASSIEGKFPGGRWQTASSVTQFYVVRDPRTVLGVGRSKKDAFTFVLSGDGRLRSVIVTFPNNDRTFADLLNRTREHFGAVTPRSETAGGEESLVRLSTFSSVWPPDEGIAVSLVKVVSLAGNELILTIENTTIRTTEPTGLE
jgi:hypothetical protein